MNACDDRGPDGTAGLCVPDVEAAGGEVDVAPAQRACLADAQAAEDERCDEGASARRLPVTPRLGVQRAGCVE